MNVIKVGIAQEAPVFMNLEASTDHAVDLIVRAAKEGLQLFVFPETWLPGYPVWLDYAPSAGLWDDPGAKAVFSVLVANSPTLDGPQVKRLRETAREYNITVVMGVNERKGGTLYNTILFLHADGETVHVHRKLVPTYTERLVWGRGDGSTLKTLETAFGKVGGLVCWEHWMPFSRAALHARGEMVHVAQWPMVKDLHQIASRHYAFEGQCFVLAAGAVLSRQEVLDGYRSVKGPPAGFDLLDSIPEQEGGLLLRGGSAIIAPDTSYLASPLQDRAGLIIADLDPIRITEGRLTMDTDGHYSRPDIFRLEIDERPQMNVAWK